MSIQHSLPVRDNVKFVDVDTIKKYLACLFSDVDWHGERWLCIRGIGEKGTIQEKKHFSEDTFIQPRKAGALDEVVAAAMRYAQNHIALFCVPGVLKAPEGSSANVEIFTNLLVDLDSGDTDAKLAHLTLHVGRPTMVVLSGGVTDEGKDKLHIYYKIAGGSDDIPLCVRLRDSIAKKAGGDKQFGIGVKTNPYGRAHQPVRIAGSCHAKKGNARAVTIKDFNGDYSYSIEQLTLAVDGMPYGPWATPEPEQVELPANGKSHVTDGKIFGPDRNLGHMESEIADSLKNPVYEGGTDKTRFDEFSKVAGFFIRQARDGRMSVDEAEASVEGWAMAKMIPCWPPERLRKEFWALLNLDTARKGAIREPDAPRVDPALMLTAPSAPQAVSMPATAPRPPSGILDWVAARWMAGETPQHKFLVDKLMILGEPHMLVAEGGAGKTGLILDLGLKIAGYEAARAAGVTLEWCGQKIVGGGRVVLVLNEDSQTEIHIRTRSIDHQNLLGASGDNLIILPMSSLTGSFPLVERGQNGTTKSSPNWDGLIKTIQQLGGASLIVLDTFNSVSHGDENSAVVISEVVREARRACAQCGAALLMTHHLRKNGQEPIRSLAELRDCIRGSSAIEAAFRVVMGFFKAVDYDRRMKAMGMTPSKDALWRFGVCKANIVGLFRGEKTLLRGENGILLDCTDEDKFNSINNVERMAWVILAIVMAAKAGHPYSIGGKNSATGLYKRRAELPLMLRKVGGTEFSILVENALQEGKLVMSARGSKEKKWLDAPDGPLAIDDPDAEMNAGAYVPPDFSDFVYSNRDHVVVHKDLFVQPFKNGITMGMAGTPVAEAALHAVTSQAAEEVPVGKWNQRTGSIQD